MHGISQEVIMVRMSRFLAVVVPVVLALADSLPRADLDQDAAAAVRKLLDEIMAADNAGDLDRVMAAYTENAILIPPGAADIAGVAAIRKHYTGAFEKLKLDLAATADEIRVADKWAVVRGRVTGTIVPKAGGDPTKAHDKFMAVAEQGADGRWRMARIMWSTFPAD
jgi:uncharacterized protein (TIGR02246 family)